MVREIPKRRPRRINCVCSVSNFGRHRLVGPFRNREKSPPSSSPCRPCHKKGGSIRGGGGSSSAVQCPSLQSSIDRSIAALAGRSFGCSFVRSFVRVCPFNRVISLRLSLSPSRMADRGTLLHRYVYCCSISQTEQKLPRCPALPRTRPGLFHIVIRSASAERRDGRVASIEQNDAVWCV